MKSLLNLEDLLQHEITDLSSAEDQIIEALPEMMSNANNPALKEALSEHLEITKQQKRRLKRVEKVLGMQQSKEKKGMFSRIFGEGEYKCRGIEGLIEESRKM